MKQKAKVRKDADSSKGPSDKKLIRLTKIKQWYLPADVKSYKRLKKAGVPLLRFHERMLPTVAMIAKRKGIMAKEVSFKETILNPFLDRLSEEWTKLHEDTQVKIDSKTIKLQTTHREGTEAVEPVLDDLRGCVERFMERWGYGFTFEVSKKRDKLLVHVEYWYSDTKNPVLHLHDDPAQQQTFEFEIGFLKFSFTTDDTYLNTIIYALQGGRWAPTQTSRCLYSQINNVQPMIEGLLALTGREPGMAERVTPTVA